MPLAFLFPFSCMAIWAGNGIVSKLAVGGALAGRSGLVPLDGGGPGTDSFPRAAGLAHA